MSSTDCLRDAQLLLAAALEKAEQERDRAVFAMARGESSVQQLQRLVERVALIQALWQQSQSVIGAQRCPPLQARFRPGEIWFSQDGPYRVEPAPLIPSCIQLVALGSGGSGVIYRHPSNTRRFQRLWP